MRVQFNYTQEDMVDASIRVLARSKTISRARWQGLLWTTGLTWVLTWILLFVVFGASRVGFFVGLCVALVNALMYPSLYWSRAKKNLRKLHKETFGDTNDFVCEVELTPAGVFLRQQTSQNTIEWRKVEEVLVTADSVDIFIPGGGVIVRDRAFKSADEREEFVASAHRYLDIAKQADSST